MVVSLALFLAIWISSCNSTAQEQAPTVQSPQDAHAVAMPSTVVQNTPNAPMTAATAIVAQQTPDPVKVTPARMDPKATAAPVATSTRAASASPRSNSHALTLAVTNPVDASIVNTHTVMVAGQSLPDAVVSVNGELANMDPQGNFHLTIQLDEGPNILEVVASDDSGTEVNAILSLIYEP